MSVIRRPGVASVCARNQLKNEQTGRDHRQHNCQRDNLAAGVMRDRLVGPTSDSRTIPSGVISKAQENASAIGNPINEDDDDNLHRPLRRIKRGKKNRRRLNRQPRDHCISDRDFVNIAPLQLGEEIIDLHCFASDFGASDATIFSKRGSWRSGSQSSSSLSEP